MSELITLLDLANETDNGDFIQIAENMTQENEILHDIHWVEASHVNSHLFAFETVIPTGATRAYNRGVAADYAKNKQATADIIQHSNPVEADAELVKQYGDAKRYMSRKALRNAEGSSQWLAENMIYGNRAVDPLGFNGLSLIFGSLADERVINAKGSGSNLRSMHLIEWGEDKIYMVYPKGKKFPIEVKKMKECYLTDENNNRFEGLRVEVYMRCALVVQNPKYYSRICNINPSIKTGDGSFHEDYLIDATTIMKGRGAKAKIYSDATMFGAMEKRANEKSNVFYNVDGPFATKVPSYGGRPFRLVEAMNPEDAVA